MNQVYILLGHTTYEGDAVLMVRFDRDVAIKDASVLVQNTNFDSYELERWTERGCDPQPIQEWC